MKYKTSQIQEGMIVSTSDDSFRVRRNHGSTLEVVNRNQGYQEIPTNEVVGVHGQTCGICDGIQPWCGHGGQS
jgi:hypothetical protein